MVFMLDEFETAVPYDEVFKYITPLLAIDSFTFSDNPDMPITYTRTSIPAVKCGDLRAAGKLVADYFINLGSYINIIDDRGVCFDTTGLYTTIEGAYSDLHSSTLSLAILPCSLSDTSMCKDHSSIARSLIQIFKLEASVNMAVKDKPIKYAVNSDFLLKLNPSIENMIRNNLIGNEIIDTSGFLFPQVSVVNYTQASFQYSNSGWRDTNKISCIAAEFADLSCRPYILNILLTSNTKVTYTRNYKKACSRHSARSAT